VSPVAPLRQSIHCPGLTPLASPAQDVRPVAAAIARLLADRAGKWWCRPVQGPGDRRGKIKTDKVDAGAGESRAVARLMIGTLEGAMLVPKTYRDPARFSAATMRLLADILEGSLPPLSPESA
jgi:hypothetical protein